MTSSPPDPDPDPTPQTPTLEHYSCYTELELASTMRHLASLAVRASGKLAAVRTKYLSSKFMKISAIPELQSTMLHDLAGDDGGGGAV